MGSCVNELPLIGNMIVELTIKYLAIIPTNEELFIRTAQIMIPIMVIILTPPMILYWLYHYIKFRRDRIIKLVEELKIQEK